MIRFLAPFAIVILAIFAFACNSADRKVQTSGLNKDTPQASNQTSPKAPNDGVRRITTVELQDLISKGQAYVVDVRNEASFNQGHIPGAVLVPTTDVLKRAKEFPRDKTIVTYCS